MSISLSVSLYIIVFSSFVSFFCLSVCLSISLSACLSLCLLHVLLKVYGYATQWSAENGTSLISMSHFAQKIFHQKNLLPRLFFLSHAFVEM
jgi:hypothetical protein